MKVCVEICTKSSRPLAPAHPHSLPPFWLFLPWAARVWLADLLSAGLCCLPVYAWCEVALVKPLILSGTHSFFSPSTGFFSQDSRPLFHSSLHTPPRPLPCVDPPCSTRRYLLEHLHSCRAWVESLRSLLPHPCRSTLRPLTG